MPQQELHQKLKELHAELTRMGATGSVDAESQHLLAELQEDIEAVLERSASENPQGLGDRLQDLVQHFETTHPALAGAMGAVADQLSKLGI
ncbi:MAG: DUF4404 family protein [Deltaproteobacteria bacterium]|nr:DUF4404 family protein [Deltaproteobacteria bacterium]